jgi:hypothetical protein
MSIPVLGNIITMRVWTTQAEQAAVNTFHYLVVAVGGTGANLQTIADAFDTAISADWRSLVPSECEYKGAQAYVDQVPLPNFAIGNAHAGGGGAAGVTQARQACGIITWITAFAGRAFRGRSYMPFPPTTDDQSGGIPTNLYLAALSTMAGDLLAFGTAGTGGNTTTMQMVLLHKKNKAGVTPPPSAITLGFPRPRFATQKRRGSYGRANSSPI